MKQKLSYDISSRYDPSIVGGIVLYEDSMVGIVLGRLVREDRGRALLTPTTALEQARGQQSISIKENLEPQPIIK